MRKQCGLAVTSLFSCVGLTFFLSLLSAGCTKTASDRAKEPAVPRYSGPARSFRRSEFTARADRLHPTSQVFVSTVKDKICLASMACYQFGSYAHPENGWTVVIPNEKAFLRVRPGLVQTLRQAGQTRRASMLETKLQTYGLSDVEFPQQVSWLRDETVTPGASVWLEERGPLLIRVSQQKTRHSTVDFRRGLQLTDAFSHTEYCPELGIRAHPEVSNLTEESVADTHWSVPVDFSELFAEGTSEPPSILQGLLPVDYRQSSVKTGDNQVEELWVRGDGTTVVLQQRTFATPAQAQAAARREWQEEPLRKGWSRPPDRSLAKSEAGRYWHRPRFASFHRGEKLVNISLLGHDDPQLPLKLARLVDGRLGGKTPPQAPE